MSAERSCEPVHRQTLSLRDHDYLVYRCSWGWCVKHDDQAYRARTLLEAFEAATSGPADRAALSVVVDGLTRALDAEYAREQQTVSTVVSLHPAASGEPHPAAAR